MSAFNALNRKPGFKYSPEPTETQHELFRQFTKVKIETKELDLVVYVPEKIATGQVQTSYSVHVFWHGGGMLTGNAEYEQWYQEHLGSIIDQKLVVIWPQYRLMPESDSKEIEEDIPNLGYFLSNGSIDQYLLQKLPNIKALFSKQDIVCSGVSAGGHMAFICWVKWDELEDVRVRIGLMPTYYAMWGPYKRQADNKYCNVKPTAEELEENGLNQVEEAAFRRGSGEKVRGRIPPDHMDSLALTACRTHATTRDGKESLVSLWQLLWNGLSTLDYVRAWSNTATTLQEENGCIHIPPSKIKEKIGEAGLSALNLTLDQDQKCFILGYEPMGLGSPPSYCPQFDYVHGTEDRNCKLEDTHEVRRFIEIQYGKEYISGEEVPGKNHGFDITGTHDQLQRHQNRVCAFVRTL